MHEWITLTNHYGETFDDPSDIELNQALTKVFNASDNEHPDAWIECGSENGPLYSLAVYSSGYAIFTKFDNADMDTELESKRMNHITIQKAMELWKSLIQGEFENIK